MWRHYRNDNNPFYRHLTRNWDDYHPEFPWLAMSIIFGPGLCIGLTLIGLFCSAMSEDFSFLFRLCLPIGVLAIFLTPPGLGITTARFVARHAGTQDFELTLLTNLTEAQIVWGYWGTITHRFRWNGLPLSQLLPYALSLIVVFLSLIFFGTGEFAIFMMVILGGYLGWYWSSQVLGLTLGLALRQQKFAIEIMVGIMLLLTGLWGWGLLRVGRILSAWLFDLQLAGYRITEGKIGFIVFWFVAPFVLGLAASRLAYYFVRNPLGNEH